MLHLKQADKITDNIKKNNVILFCQSKSINIKHLFSHFYVAQSKDFGQNSEKCVGKKLFYICFNMADRQIDEK